MNSPVRGLAEASACGTCAYQIINKKTKKLLEQQGAWDHVVDEARVYFTGAYDFYLTIVPACFGSHPAVLIAAEALHETLQLRAPKPVDWAPIRPRLNAQEAASAGPSRAGANKGRGVGKDINAGRQRTRNNKGRGRNRKGKERADGGEDSGGDDDDVTSCCGPGPDGGDRRLACPIYRYDPVAHHECLAFELKGPSAVKQHLTRRHNPDQRCCVCGTYFTSVIKKGEHEAAHQHQPCRATPIECDYHDLDVIQFACLELFYSAQTDRMDVRGKWNWMWELVCPEQGMPPHPDIFLDSWLYEILNVTHEASDRGARRLPPLLEAHGVGIERHDALIHATRTVFFGPRLHHETNDVSITISRRERLLPRLLADHGIEDPYGVLANGIVAAYFGRSANRVAPPLQNPPPQDPPLALLEGGNGPSHQNIPHFRRSPSQQPHVAQDWLQTEPPELFPPDNQLDFPGYPPTVDNNVADANTMWPSAVLEDPRDPPSITYPTGTYAANYTYSIDETIATQLESNDSIFGDFEPGSDSAPAKPDSPESWNEELF